MSANCFSFWDTLFPELLRGFAPDPTGGRLSTDLLGYSSPNENSWRCDCFCPYFNKHRYWLETNYTVALPAGDDRRRWRNDNDVTETYAAPKNKIKTTS